MAETGVSRKPENNLPDTLNKPTGPERKEPPHPNTVFFQQVKDLTKQIWEATEGEPITGRIATAFVAPIEACAKVNPGQRADVVQKFVIPRAMSLAYITELTGIVSMMAATTSPEFADKAVLATGALVMFIGGFLLLRQGVDQAHRVLNGSRRVDVNRSIREKFLGLIPTVDKYKNSSKRRYGGGIW